MSSATFTSSTDQTTTDYPRHTITPTRNGHPEANAVNVSETERWISTVGGAVLAVLGVRRTLHDLGHLRLPIGGVAFAGLGAALIQRGVTGHCHGYQALGIRTSHNAAEPIDYFRSGVHVEQSFTINKSREELYQFWRNFENLPRFMSHLDSVRVLDGNKSHWVAKAPKFYGGGQVEWDAEIINDEPNRVIAWRSLDNADVDNAGSVRFIDAPAGRGTEVRVVLDYIPPAGRVGSLIAKLFLEEPNIQVREDLRAFKQIMETGEVATTEGQPMGKCV
ncbi:MAG TPA: SRPBCC family protein [Tepidisphaeraceae bacterium]|nr:SRPBCC family protein [Tepidisphaeraceae bacterium]